MLQLKTKSGLLTRYALACGYIQKFETQNGRAVLEQISTNGTIQVYSMVGNVRLNPVFRTIKEARKEYFNRVKQLKNEVI